MPDTSEGHKPFDQEQLLEESLCRNAIGAKGAVRLPVLEYKRLHDITGPESGETLHGDGSYEASERKKNMEYL